MDQINSCQVSLINCNKKITLRVLICDRSLTYSLHLLFVNEHLPGFVSLLANVVIKIL